MCVKGLLRFVFNLAEVGMGHQPSLPFTQTDQSPQISPTYFIFLAFLLSLTFFVLPCTCFLFLYKKEKGCLALNITSDLSGGKNKN